MASYPLAVQRRLPEDGSQRATERKRLIIVHSVVGAVSPFPYFRDQTNLESTFWCSLKGLIEQYLDTDQRADANFHANDEAVSIETADNGDPDNFPWTEAQLDALAHLIAWLCLLYGIPARLPDGPYGTGVGYHTEFGAPGEWTPVQKSCPGAARIRQFPELLRRVNVLLQPTKDEFMASISPAAQQKLAADAAASALMLKQLQDALIGPDGVSESDTLDRIIASLTRIESRLSALEAK